jgi:hypothetical protein
MNVHKLNKATEVYLIPSLEDFSGFAVGVVGDADLSGDFDGSVVCGANALVFNPDRTIFIVNCSHPLFQDKSIKSKVDKGLLDSLSLAARFGKVEDDSIEKYFDGSFVVPQSKPVVEPDPQPDPQEVAKEWYPMDELPDNGE